MIELIIPYRTASIGAFDVRRVLPFRKRRSVGPFVFVDDFGPMQPVTDGSIDVLAHPHIGLATVTFLSSGKMTHRDSLGSVQVIAPGEVNWMTAGRGVVHSERVSDAPNAPDEPVAGIQTWVALPERDEESDPSFEHYPADVLPVFEDNELSVKVILGEINGVRSPVATRSGPVYAECRSRNGGSMMLPISIEERSIYVLSGSVRADGQDFGPGTLIVFAEKTEALVTAAAESKFMVLGGPRLEKPRSMWWNFVATRKELIEQAMEDWREGKFPEIPNETGFVPLPVGSFPKPQPL